jgi:hypothetical protein
VLARPGTLANPDVCGWLDGVRPAWTLLDVGNFNALRHAAPSPEGAIRLAVDLTPDGTECSAVARNARFCNAEALQAVLFHTTIWQLSLNYFARGLHGAWP